YKADPLGLNDIDFGEEPFDAEDDMRDTALGKMDDNIFSIFPSSKVGKDIDIYEIAPYGISCFSNRGGERGIRTKDHIPNEKGMMPNKKGDKRRHGKSLTRKPSK
ncbi:hypothetical protein, partial [Salmonella enterica]|uniref:hypothetical protein n=1 Tax=Salmonella enterica TaxID=28901 RepID=UPI000AC3549B